MNKIFLSLDDDTIFNIRKIDHHPLLPYQSQNNPLPTLHLKNSDHFEHLLKTSQTITGKDFFHAHETQLALGSTLSLTGYAGDSGLSNPKYIFGLEDAPLKSILSSKDLLNESITSRLVWRQPINPTQSKLSTLMPIACVFNNELELPPFFPMGRNQDGAYAYALNACLENSKLGYLDMAILHRPVEVRNYHHALNIYQLRINDLISFIWVEFLKSNRPKGYQSAAMHFESFANQEFSIITQLIQSQINQRIERINQKINFVKNLSLPAGPEWILLAEQEIKVLNNYLSTTDYLPIEISHFKQDKKKGQDLTKEWIANYSKLLFHWKQLRAISQLPH